MSNNTGDIHKLLTKGASGKVNKPAPKPDNVPLPEPPPEPEVLANGSRSSGKILRQRQLLFIQGIMEKGMFDYEAAIYAGVSPSNAHTEAWRMKNDPEVIQFIDDIYRANILSHKQHLANAIKSVSKILNSATSSDKSKLEAAKMLLDLYNAQITNDILEGATKKEEATVIDSLANRVLNPVRNRQMSDFE